ncbi:sprouty-related, EVH1 domain-containing protein 3-like isoform X1 [Montipora foliosa]|uniref:sprouty-related, EVH1 domain-containing protein 3-like isoform X1 n=2 Tax=Montipora foliosa TaxID=591990 RepID=UPI0035F1D73B
MLLYNLASHENLLAKLSNLATTISQELKDANVDFKMHHQHQLPSCASQIEIDVRGEYCTIQQDYSLKAEGAHTPDPGKNSQVIHPSNNRKTEYNNINMSPQRKLSRSRSSPEYPTSSTHDNSSEKDKKSSAAANGYQSNGKKPSFIVSSGRRSTACDLKVGKRRSTGSLTGREPFPPLRYFAYLGRYGPSTKTPQRPRNRLPSAHDILADRPVLLTSTSLVSPFATNVIRQEIEEIEQQEVQADYGDLLDCCTCMCCVKALFYHCTHDSDDESTLAEHPCSCKGPAPECVGRWGIMGLVSIFLPCLLCYLPFEAYFRCHECATREVNTEAGNSAGHLSKHQCPVIVTQEPTSSFTSSRAETGM